MKRWILLAIGLGGLLALPAGARAGQGRLPAPRLEAQDCAPGDRACVTPRGPLLESDPLECDSCGPAQQPTATSVMGTTATQPSRGSGERALLCSMGDMPLGPDIPGCVKPPTDLNSVPPL